MKNLLTRYSEYQRDILLFSNDYIKHNYCSVYKFIQRCNFYKLDEIEEISIENIINYLEDYKNSEIITGPNRGQKPKQNSLSGAANSIKQFFKYCAMVGKNLQFNREQIPMIKKERGNRDMMKKEEYEILRTAPMLFENDKLIAKRNQLLIDIPRTMGLRRIEVLRCKFEGFHSENRQFMIKGKGGYIDPCFFTESLKEQVLEYEEQLQNRYSRSFEWVICGLDNKNFGNQLSVGTVDNIIKKYSDLLIEKGLINRQLTLHMERHSFATNCVYSGLSQQATMQLMRHKDPKTTLAYYHIKDSWLCNQFDMISDTY